MHNEENLSIGKKKYVHLYQCKPGDILADDLYNDNGILIVAKGTVINEHTIKRIEAFRVRQLSVYESRRNRKTREKNILYIKKFKRDYEENLDIVKQVLNALVSGEKLDYKKIEYISKSIYSQISNTSQIVECMNAIKNISEYTYTHSINVSIYSMLLARWLCLSEKETKEVVTTGVLHDIGKSRIPIEILNKKGPLLPEEYEEVKKHAAIGSQLTENIPDITNHMREGIYMHHEREDGKGYPLGIKGDRINLYAKIISVADVYDALTSERVYKKRMTPFDTFLEFSRIGYGYFDTKIMMTFLSNISSYYIGSRVRMNDGKIGEVVFISQQNISKPIVNVDGMYIDLANHSQYRIIEMV